MDGMKMKISICTGEEKPGWFSKWVELKLTREDLNLSNEDFNVRFMQPATAALLNSARAQLESQNS